MENKVIKTRNAMIWMDEHGICHESYNEGARLTFEDTVKELQIISEISGHKKVPLLVDLNNAIHVPRECRSYYAGKEGAEILKVAALLVGTQMSRVLGNFFIGLNKPTMPVKLFTSETEALKWLKEYIN
jgi:hypothetical protein